ncbi:MAG TPA: M14 family zinc carboxypeptidase [Gemmatimonadaceae bacterium]|nr:M14 family zinc carboxypeptidase [Gemmatimonadaceae bacterium]
MRSILRSLLCITLASGSAAAQGAPPSPRDSALDTRGFSFYDRGPYRPGVPRPESVLGYQVGELNTQFAMQERVLLAIAAAATDRVRVEEIGSSYERRTMRLFIVSAPENIQRLDAIRADLDRIADPRSVAQAELDAIAARVPVVVWINESVHGNESPGFETAMQTLYQLAASEEPATVNALRNAIVVLNPSSNPDGHERFTVWYNSIHVADPNPGSMEHDEPWSIQGRFNHYRFDMNRDVMTTTQREPQALVRAMLRWHPMVAVDQHGQVTSYFFPPAARPVNENLGGADAAKWLTAIGRGNADAFDRYGWMYYSRDVFDLYGPFYWDTWPGLTGATGMTYETDGGGWKGLLWRREDGSLLSFRDGIAKHYVSAMATIQTTAERRQERVRDYLRFRQGAVAEGRTGTMKRVVLVPGSDPGRAAELVSTLLRAGIEVRRADAAFASTRAHAYASDADVRGGRRFDAGAYVIDLAQPQGRMAKAFLEPSPTLDPEFSRLQVEKFRRNIRRAGGAGREGYEFYDVTAWSLPVTFGVEAYWTEDAPTVSGNLLSLPGEACTERSECEPALPQAQQTARRVGGELLAVDIPGGIIAGRPARSAYLFTAERNGSARLAYHLMREGYRLAVATLPVEAGGRRWPRGSYIVRVSRNDTLVHARLDQLARESGVEVTGVNSAFTGEAQYGIGSEAVAGLVAPRVALVGDEGISQTSYGAVWWAFERRYGLRFTPISLQYLSFGDLTAFNVIVVPDAQSGAVGRILGKEGADRLRGWVQGGGTLITMGGASAWAAREGVNLTSARMVGSDTTRDTTGISAPKPDSSGTAPAAAGGGRRRGSQQQALEQAGEKRQDDLLAATSPSASNAAPASLPGTHFDVVLDRTHWLTHGYEDPRLTVMLDGSTFFKLSKEGTNVAVFPTTGALHRAGFVWPENSERLLRGTALLVEEPLGDGHVILFANEPMFRGWWRALDRLVLNGVLLGPAF